jgi:hypothetical protein
VMAVTSGYDDEDGTSRGASAGGRKRLRLGPQVKGFR